MWQLMLVILTLGGKEAHALFIEADVWRSVSLLNTLIVNIVLYPNTEISHPSLLIWIFNKFQVGLLL